MCLLPLASSQSREKPLVHELGIHRWDTGPTCKAVMYRLCYNTETP